MCLYYLTWIQQYILEFRKKNVTYNHKCWHHFEYVYLVQFKTNIFTIWPGFLFHLDRIYCYGTVRNNDFLNVTFHIEATDSVDQYFLFDHVLNPLRSSRNNKLYYDHYSQLELSLRGFFNSMVISNDIQSPKWLISLFFYFY